MSMFQPVPTITISSHSSGAQLWPLSLSSLTRAWKRLLFTRLFQALGRSLLRVILIRFTVIVDDLILR